MGASCIRDMCSTILPNDRSWARHPKQSLVKMLMPYHERLAAVLASVAAEKRTQESGGVRQQRTQRTQESEAQMEEAVQFSHRAAQAAFLATFLGEREDDHSTPDSAKKFPPCAACPVLLASERYQLQ